METIRIGQQNRQSAALPRSAADQSAVEQHNDRPAAETLLPPRIKALRTAPAAIDVLSGLHENDPRYLALASPAVQWPLIVDHALCGGENNPLG